MKRTISNVTLFACLGLLLMVLAGCQGTADGFSGERGSVSGLVTVDGEPVPEGCQVMFIAPTGSYVASAVTRADGEYSLRYQLSAGMPATNYGVQVSPPVAENNEEENPTDPMELAAVRADAKQKKSGSDEEAVIPVKYKSTATSKLTFTVDPGPNRIDLELSRDK